MTLPALDFETFSPAGYEWNPETGKHHAPRGSRDKGLPVVGVAVYTEHPDAEVLTASYNLLDGHGVRRWKPGDPLPVALFDHLARGGLLEAHNLMFEVMVWLNICEAKYGWPPIAPHFHQLRCSAAKARVASLPGALEPLSAVLGTPGKDPDGKRLMKKFSMPRDPTKKDPRRRILPTDEPEEFERYCSYCDDDVTAEQAASGATPPMTDDELHFWQIDQEINRRGVAVDRPALRDCMAVLEQAIAQYGEEFRALTGGLDPTQLQATRGWLAAKGVRMDSMDEAAIDEALDRLPPHPPGVVWAPRRVLETRQRIGSASVKKLYAMEHQANRNDRLQNLIVHHGARTGRPTGGGPQPLNLPRSGPKLVSCGACERPFHPGHTGCPWCGSLERKRGDAQWTAPMVDYALEIMASRSLHLVEWFFGDALLTISGCLRGLFVAAPGHDLIASDYSAIEAVVIAMLAGEQWRIDAFREGKPIYLVGASKITGRSVEEYEAYAREYNDHHPDRQKIGKVSELACLGPDTLVLSEFGWVPIVNVRPGDRVFDGVDWVEQSGVVDRGVRPVLQIAGVTATPDHRFLAGYEWMTAKDIIFTPGAWGRVLANDAQRAGIIAPALRCAAPTGLTRVYDLADCGPRHRFVIATEDGPVLAHNCGFGGWIGSYKAFGSTEPDDVIKAQILAWRAASPAIVELWGGQFRGLPWEHDRRPELYGFEGMAIAAVQNPGAVYEHRGVLFFMDGDALIVRLLSGRRLTYHTPRLYPSTRSPGALTLIYMTWNSNPKYGPPGWVPMETYGGRLVENCIAEGTEVLTGRGWVSIERVRDDDLVHDGVELVNHQGVLYKGRQECLVIDGVQMTPDHRVLTDDGWQAASQSPRPYRPALRDVDGPMPCAREKPGAKGLMVLCVRLRRGLSEGRRKRDQDRQNRPRGKLWMPDQRTDRHGQPNAWADGPPDVRRVERNEATMSLCRASGILSVRGAGDRGLPAMAQQLRNILGGHVADVAARLGLGPTRQRPRVLPRKLPMDHAEGKQPQPPHDAVCRDARGAHDRFGRRGKIRDQEKYDPLSSQSRLADGGDVSPARRDEAGVYDIVNCGPRTRFVVRGASGPFIVHNCVQAIAHDILRHAIVNLRAAGYPTVLHVYDEIVGEIPVGTGSIEDFERIMNIMPPWAHDWPVRAAGGWRGRRYRKS